MRGGWTPEERTMVSIPLRQAKNPTTPSRLRQIVSVSIPLRQAKNLQRVRNPSSGGKFQFLLGRLKTY